MSSGVSTGTQNQAAAKELGILGAGFNLGQPLDGVRQGPSALMGAGLASRASKLGWTVTDYGDLNFSTAKAGSVGSIDSSLPPIHHVREAGMACQLIAEQTSRILSEGRFCLTIGGDHSIAIGSISGIAQKATAPLRVIWIDAHADYNTPASSESHNLHGMPLAALTGRFDISRYPGFEAFANYPTLKPEHVALVGVRSVDDEELKLVEESGIHLYTMAELDRYGIDAVLRDAEEKLNRDERGERLAQAHYHLSYDIDALDPSLAPNTGTCVQGGLTYREAHYIAEFFHQTGRLRSMDLVEVNPGLGRADGGSTIAIATELVESALGKRTAPARILPLREAKPR